ncbi:MAG TPA: sensor histidine kinase KdpD [Planktothrix sp.]|jgi:two-component system sensor histidine kinase KdpD
MPDRRPNPEEILARVKEEEAWAGKGKLKIFLGMAAGVGKTYKMLEHARALKKEGVDVVAGCVVTHGRKETEQLLDGVDVMPLVGIEYKGATLEEFDLDAALKRKSAVLLVDELAHTNAPGCRHEKRWQDIEELLDAGIDVYTTLNIQHLESANDIVAQITHVKVRETIPDSFFDRAYEIELVDLPPDELIQRLKEGKVYVPDRSNFALQNFFRKGNLIALRELALRSTAERVDRQMQKYREHESIKTVWPASERVLVCVGPSPLSIRVVRAARRIASSLHAEWLAVYVETPAYARMRKSDRLRLTRTLRLAQQLGAEITVLQGTNVSEELVSYAQHRNVSKILIGKPARPRWKEILFGSVVDELIRRSGDIEIDVITGDGSDISVDVDPREIPTTQTRYADYMKALAIVVCATIIANSLSHMFSLVNLVMIYQLAVVLIAVRYGRGPSIISSVLSVLLCDFFFVPPYLSFAVSDTQYLVTLAVMLITALTLSHLTYNVKHQAEQSRLRERRTAALYRMTRGQAFAATKDEVIKTSVEHLHEVFESEIAVFLTDEHGQFCVVQNLEHSFPVDNHEFGVAHWAFTNGLMSGAATSTLPGARGLYVPLRGSSKVIGVVGIKAQDSARFLHPEEMHLLDIFVNQIAPAIERAALSEQHPPAASRTEAESNATPQPHVDAAAEAPQTTGSH